MFGFVVCLVVVIGSIAGVVHFLDLGHVDGRSAARQPATAPPKSKRERRRAARRGSSRGRGLVGLAVFVTIAGVLAAALFGGTALLIDLAMRHAAR